MTTIDELRKHLIIDYGRTNELAKWLSEIDVNFTHAVTLTFEKNETDRIIGERTLGLFIRYLNERAYRRAFTKGDKRIKVIATLEGLSGNGKRMHYHLAIGMPDYMSNRQVREEIQCCWDKANKLRETQDDIKWHAKNKNMSVEEVQKKGILRNNKIDVSRFTDNGWISYIAKEFNIGKLDCLSEHCNF